MYLYPVGSDQAARINLDQKAANDGYEDARASFPDAVLSSDDLKDYANRIVDESLETREDLTDDPEEYRARYVDAYCTAYSRQIEDMRHDQEEEA